jgi:hypothetical protein
VSGDEVDRDDLRRRVSQPCPGILADEFACPIVVSPEEGVGRIHRVGGAVDRDHQDPGVPGFPNGRDDGLGIARRDHDDSGTGRDLILDSGHLPGVVSIGAPSAGHEPDARVPGGTIGASTHRHEEGIGLRLGDEADQRPGVVRRAAGQQGEREHGEAGQRGGPCRSGGERQHEGIISRQARRWATG